MTSLKADVIEAMVAHAREAAPAECCGLLLGRGDAIVEAVRARNIADVATRFVIDPSDHFAALRNGRQRGLDVLGFYHSHPRSPAIPSETDVGEASYPDHLYAIVSLAADPADVRLFHLVPREARGDAEHGRTGDAGNFVQVAFVTVG